MRTAPRLGAVVRALLLQACSVGINPESEARRDPVRAAAIDCARILFDAGAAVNARDAEGYTPLMWARGESVRLLLARGAELHAVSSAGLTALMMAAWMGEVNAVRELIDAGANAEARDQAARTALDYAQQTRQRQRGFWPFVFRLLSTEYRACCEAAAQAEQQIAAAVAH
jgi:hypothetical protein